jgi:hypothetical protein
MTSTIESGYKDKAEVTREFYRKQGEARAKQRILDVLQLIQEQKPEAAWSPEYLMKVIKQL